MLVDPKLNRVIIPPFGITNIGEKVRTFRLQFQAPPQIGDFSFMAQIMSDSVLGTDTRRRVVLKISEPPKVQEVEDDISEPDEDTIAGQLQSMRGGSVKKHGDEDDTDDSFEDSDEEDDDNTDTDSADEKS